jgi:hypothetical protein
MNIVSAGQMMIVNGNNTTYPVSLTIKQCSRLLNHLLICFFLANASGEVRRVGMHLNLRLNSLVA